MLQKILLLVKCLLKVYLDHNQAILKPKSCLNILVELQIDEPSFINSKIVLKCNNMTSVVKLVGCALTPKDTMKCIGKLQGNISACDQPNKSNLDVSRASIDGRPNDLIFISKMIKYFLVHNFYKVF